MHVYSVNVHVGEFHNAQQMRYLVNAYPKFGIDMSNRNIGISARHHMRVDSDTDRDIGMLAAKLL